LPRDQAKEPASCRHAFEPTFYFTSFQGLLEKQFQLPTRQKAGQIKDAKSRKQLGRVHEAGMGLLCRRGLNPLRVREAPGTQRHLAESTRVFRVEITSQKVDQTSLLLSWRTLRTCVEYATAEYGQASSQQFPQDDTSSSCWDRSL
jgi:hypothetical protein